MGSLSKDFVLVQDSPGGKGMDEFRCQNPRCRKPLEVDESLFKIDIDSLPQSLEDLETLLKDYELLESKGEEAGSKEETIKRSSKEDGEQQNGIESSPVSKVAHIFDVVSAMTHMDQPLCKECTQKHLKKLETQVAEAVKENSSYKGFLNRLRIEKEKYPTEEQLEQEIKSVEEEEKALRESLKQIEEERRLLKQEMKHLEEESNKIRDIEEKYWQNFTQFQYELQIFQEQSAAVKTRLNNAEDELEKLKITNVYNDTFHIWHDGHFGTINNFRLGRLPSQPVDWNEINAAWGQATLLLQTIAKKLNFTFSTFRLLPMGSCSKMEKINDQSSYELYGSSDISLGRLFWYRRFDNGMMAFLACLRELGDYAEFQDRTFKLPYRIDKDKIGEMSIKIQFNNEETWTKALKYMLTNLKFLLVWLAKEVKE